MIFLLEFDKSIFTWINTGWSNSVLVLVMPWISHLADPSIVWLWVVFIGLLAQVHHQISDLLRQIPVPPPPI